MQRAGLSRVHKLTLDAPAPAKQVVLANMKNKIQLNALLVDGLFDPKFVADATQNHVLTIAGVSDIPVEITDGKTTNRQDLRSTHEEADVIITQHSI